MSMGSRVLNYLTNAGLNPTVTSPVALPVLVYIDGWASVDTAIISAIDAGATVVTLAFYLPTAGAYDAATSWAALSPSTKTSTLEHVHAAGAVILVAIGGETDSPWTHDAATLGAAVAPRGTDTFAASPDVSPLLTGSVSVSSTVTSTSAGLEKAGPRL